MSKKLITPPYTALILRIILGVIFIYASFDKILHPDQFARSIINYRILPWESINLFALILPWLEFVSGILLLLGLGTSGSIVVIACLLIMFLVAIGSALMRGIDISCGCFASRGAHKINILYLIRDLILLAIALQVFLFDRRILSLDGLIHKKGDSLK